MASAQETWMVFFVLQYQFQYVPTVCDPFKTGLERCDIEAVKNKLYFSRGKNKNKKGNYCFVCYSSPLVSKCIGNNCNEGKNNSNNKNNQPHLDHTIG